jgi:hypothetical protein
VRHPTSYIRTPARYHLMLLALAAVGLLVAALLIGNALSS